MKILALNSGSSSIKCALIDSESQARIFEFAIQGVGAGDAQGDAKLVDEGTQSRRELGPMDIEAAVALAMTEIHARLKSPATIDAVAHRIVHGGSSFTQPVIVNDEVLTTIAELNPLAPLHNPPALTVLRAARWALGDVPHIAVFDTAFHSTLPARAREYAVPRQLALRHGLRRFGFHGINHAHVMHAVASHFRASPQQLRIVSCHLGNGASVAAVEYGRSVETSMGMTPLEGLMMGTRSGDIDPGILIHLLKSGDFDAESLDRLLNTQSGLWGLTGTIDFEKIERLAGEGDEQCRLAITLYAHRVRKYIGAYAAVMGGVDAIAFTGGIGEHSALLRHRICQRLEFLGAILDEDRNRDVALSRGRQVAVIGAEHSRVQLLVVQADEQLQLATEAAAVLAAATALQHTKKIPIAVSARHAHLTQATIEKLFGAAYRLVPKTDLSQSGQFAAEETVTLIGPRGKIERARLMGPPRHADQIEISRSDEFVLGIDAPVRISGDLDNTPGITIEGPKGRITIPNGVICARRHIHMSVADAEYFGVRDCDTVDVRVDSDGRDLVFSDVTVRVAPDFNLELHLDTDEANAAGVMPHQQAELLVRTDAHASVVARSVTGKR